MTRRARVAKRSTPSSLQTVPDAPVPQLLHLAVGPYSSQGDCPRTMEYKGSKLAESTSEGARVVWGLGARSSLRVERVLYHLTDEDGYAVHAILRSGPDHHPVLARVELFPHWRGVANAHPDLARAVVAESRSHRPPSYVSEVTVSPNPGRRAPRAHT